MGKHEEEKPSAVNSCKHEEEKPSAVNSQVVDLHEQPRKNCFICQGRPFPHVYHGDAPQNNIAEEQRYLFSVRFRYLAFAAIGFFGPS
jgi:hypothetical protein